MNSIPGVSEEQYDKFTENEKAFFTALVENEGKLTLQEAKDFAELDFHELMQTVESLQRKGVPVITNSGTTLVYGFYYSAYAADYDERVKKRKVEFEMIKVQEKTWEAVVNYIEERMSYNRHRDGKFDKKNNELWRLKKAMQEVDPSIERVGTTFHDHEDAEYDVKR